MTADLGLAIVLNSSESIRQTTVKVVTIITGASLPVQPTIESGKDVYPPVAAA